jgi:hypothetical protein
MRLPPACILLVALCLTNVCIADVILRGDYLKAAEVASKDLLKTLSQRGEEARSSKSSDPALASKLSKIENYDISIDQTPTSFILQLGPTVRDQSVVFGGGARYVIDRSTFAITEKTFLK